MILRFFLTNVFSLPFRKKNPIAAAGICLVAASAFCFPAAAAQIKDAPAADEARQLVKQAKRLARRGEFAEAEKALRRVVEINPNEPDAKLNLAVVLLKQRQLLDAYNYSLEAAKADPKNARAFAVLGTIYLTAGNFKEAQTFLFNALQLDKQEALAWAGLGTLNFYENRIDIGLAQLQNAVYLEPSEPDYIFTLAQVAARAEDYKQAAEAYERFLQISTVKDAERRARIKGLVSFLHFLSDKRKLYLLDGAAETVVSFRLMNDRPVIQLKINGKSEPLNFVLDTGSGISVISRETAQKLKIKEISRGGLARGVGGDGKFEIVYGFLRSVSVGGVDIRNVPVYIREFHSKNEKVDGYIGLSLISKFLTTIDYGDSTFGLKKRNSVVEKTETEVISLPLRLTSSGFLSGEVQLEGIETPLNFIVDTGASISVVSSDIANSKEMSRFIGAEKMRVIGAAGITEEMPSLLLPKISFGANSRENIKAVALDLGIINETSGFEQAGILGGNFLKNYRLTFDFANSKVIFVPVR